MFGVMEKTEQLKSEAKEKPIYLFLIILAAILLIGAIVLRRLRIEKKKKYLKKLTFRPNK